MLELVLFKGSLPCKKSVPFYNANRKPFLQRAYCSFDVLWFSAFFHPFLTSTTAGRNGRNFYILLHKINLFNNFFNQILVNITTKSEMKKKQKNTLLNNNKKRLKKPFFACRLLLNAWLRLPDARRHLAANSEIADIAASNCRRQKRVEKKH